jgi:hypothetical protein
LTATMIKQGSNQALRYATFYQLKTWMLGDPALDFDRSTVKAVFQTIFAGTLQRCCVQPRAVRLTSSFLFFFLLFYFMCPMKVRRLAR